MLQANTQLQVQDNMLVVVMRVDGDEMAFSKRISDKIKEEEFDEMACHIVEELKEYFFEHVNGKPS